MFHVGQSVQHVGTGHCGRVVLVGVRQVAVMWDNSKGEHDWSPNHMVKPLPDYEQDTPAPQTAATVAQDTAYGYASAYGYLAQSVDFALAQLADVINQHHTVVISLSRAEFISLHAMLTRGNKNAHDALRRYDARIERLDLPGAGE